MLVIGIAGGSGSGKTTVVKAIAEAIKEKVAILSQDAYYHDSSMIPFEERKKINFDHPDAIDWDLLIRDLSTLKAGHAINQPVYDYVTSSRSKTETVRIEPANVIIVEGILIFAIPKLRELMDVKVFVDTEPDERLMRIIYRDILERGRDMDTAFHHYCDTVKPMHVEFIEPSKRFADIIMPEGGHNRIAIEMITNAIEKYLK